MTNLRRTKLKAKRAGCKIKAVDKCISISEVYKLMEDLRNKKEAEELDGIRE